MSFKSLVSAVSEQYQEIKHSLESFSYFDTWEPDVIAECCRVSSVAVFSPNRIILGPDAKIPHTVYLILEGVSRMIRNLQVEVRRNTRGKPVYKLCRFSDANAIKSEWTKEGFSSRLLNRECVFRQKEKAAIEREEKLEAAEETETAEFQNSEPEESKEVSIDNAEIDGNVTTTQATEENQSQSGENAIEITKELENESVDESQLEKEPEKEAQVDRRLKEEPSDGPKFKELKKEAKKPGKETKDAKELKKETAEEPKDAKESDQKEEPTFEPDLHLKILEECRKRRKEMIWVSTKGTIPEKPKNVKSFFVQIGFLHKGACFGLEKSEIFIVSATKVKCLKIPRRFLFQHNPRYVWNRISLFHSLYLPKDETIFEHFQIDRKWNERKKQLSEEIVSLKTIPNYTLTSEVPYSIRLVHMR